MANYDSVASPFDLLEFQTQISRCRKHGDIHARGRHEEAKKFEPAVQQRSEFFRNYLKARRSRPTLGMRVNASSGITPPASF